MSREYSQEEIDELVSKVARLELHTTVLKREITRLNAKLRGESVGQARNPDGSIPSPNRATFSSAVEEEYARAARNIFLDVNHRHLELGDKVYIVTRGAHTNRSRRGRVTGFDQYRNRVIVTDEVGVQQERAPKNLRKEDS